MGGAYRFVTGIWAEQRLAYILEGGKNSDRFLRGVSFISLDALLAQRAVHSYCILIPKSLYLFGLQLSFLTA